MPTFLQLLLSSPLFSVFLSAATTAYQAPLFQPHSPTSNAPAKDTPLHHLHRALVNIESISGNERAVGDYLTEYLESHNLTVHRQRIPAQSSATSTNPPRFNILAYQGDTARTRSLLTSHIDTVPPFYPYTVRGNGTEIWGRGSVDAKACVAAQVTAFLALREEGSISEGDVGLLFVVDEETGGTGMRAVNALELEWEGVVFGEPTEGKLAAGHKGILGLTLKARGKAAHSGYPWLGRSANDIMIAGLGALESLKRRDGGLPWSEKYGNTTLNVGNIDGGVARNVVAESAEAGISLRLAAGEPQDTMEICKDAVQEATRDLLGDDGEMNVEFTGEGYPPVNTDADLEGFETTTVNYGTDIPNLKGKHKRYLYGPGSILVAHSDHEHLAVDELEQAVEDYKTIVMAVLKN